MRKLAILLLLCCLLQLSPPSQAEAFVDSAGRRVELPASPARIFAAGPPASVFLYVLKPQALLGWPRALGPEERRYIAPAFRALPETGLLSGRGNESNLERVLALGLLHPDVAGMDMRREGRDFYRLYYGVELDAQALAALLPSPPPAPR